ncbi:MAG TPA: TAT-variant-translocated molybdopterin oxidoreductase [Vicinamibacterales bacterium]|nr:TAT-variant-translocated molybdopterin oxidoreductase [Vicinamibacterales bacterium]
MTLADIRTRLASLEGRAYWRSLEELSDTPEFREYLHREFPAQASEFNDPAGRREFLKLMGASLALAGVSACTRQPEEKIIPYVRQPEEIIPGRPLFYATAMPLGGYAFPLLAENHMGRPTKLEGNPEHPASLGGTDLFSQTSVLTLYDPDRSRTVVGDGEVRTWGTFVNVLQAATMSRRPIKGQGLRLLTGPVTSPSLIDQIEKLLSGMPEAKWHQWDAVFGARQGGAPAALPICRFDKADVVVALDADFLGTGPGMVRYNKDFASRRRITTPETELNRLYVVEPVTTITGAKADHRLAMKARDVHGFAAALASAIGVAGLPASTAAAQVAPWLTAVAADLNKHRGRSLVVAGDTQPAAVHALARAMNEALGNVGATVTYHAPIAASPADGTASISELVADMQAGRVDVLVIFGGNPVFTAPADLNFAEALKKVTVRVHLDLYHDETAELCQWHVPEAHFLESWGDARAFDGTVSLIQPLISPLYDGRTALELLAVMNGMVESSAMDLVKDYWTRAFAGQTSTVWSLRSADGAPYASPEAFWRHALHDGFVPSTSAIAPPAAGHAAAAPARTPSSPTAAAAATAAPGAGATAGRAGGAPATPPAAAGLAAPAPAAQTGMEIIFRPDPNILDGRFANNGWLQELPKPLSKVTWDNVAYISPKTAEFFSIPIARVGNGANDVIEIRYQGRTARMPVWVLPGTADDVVVVHFGYGRRRAGRVGTGIGVDTFGLRTSKAPWFDGGAEIVRTGESYLIASTQNHFAMEGRHPVRAVDAAEYRKDPKVVAALGHEAPPKTMTLYPVFEYTGHKWGMSIDLNSCTGCGVCVAACVAENNIAVVGKDQVSRSREMHWLRVDTYFEGDPAAPAATHHQPVPCQQCETAPCEVVCPVAATVHNDEGLNDMVYNRCVGTRYCSNNCPYKVRRFNFLLYSDFHTPELMAQRNPDVTIRSRGVMEKCTYCVQRINEARIDAKTTGDPIKDGVIKTACEQACPADAIVFGNLNDPESRVVKLKQQERNYGLLEDLNTRPRTTYLAVVKNPNPEVK